MVTHPPQKPKKKSLTCHPKKERRKGGSSSFAIHFFRGKLAVKKLQGVYAKLAFGE